MSKKKKHRRLNARIRRFSRKTLLIILTVGLTICVFFYAAVYIVLKGPSPTFSSLAVSTLWETRRGKRIVRHFFNESEIESILTVNSTDTEDVTVDLTKIETTPFDIPEDEKDEITVENVSGSTYKGKLMTIRDPARMMLGVNSDENMQGTEYLVQDYVSKNGAVAGINAGGFDDPNGQGDGSIPYGIVIKNGQLIAGSEQDWNCLIGFNETHHLIVGNMTGEQALEWGITDAVTFGPVLIYNGNRVTVTGTGGGLNPRTVIGQKEDGSVLLLVIDGRQTNSLGATYEDCIQIMLDHGAVTAANLDGGSSTVMVYNGEIINSIVTMGEGRSVPTAWLVK